VGFGLKFGMGFGLGKFWNGFVALCLELGCANFHS
jgi:hypothetical protein